MSSLYLLTAVDVRRARKAGSTRAIILNKAALPGVELAKASHNPGGGILSVDFSLPRVGTLEPKFDAKGIDTDIFDGFGQSDVWTFAGSYREKKPGGGGLVPARAIIEGAVSMWEPDESDPAEFQGCSHTFTDVTHYEFHLGGVEMFYIDFFERVFRTNGVDIFAADRQALGA